MQDSMSKFRENYENARIYVIDRNIRNVSQNAGTKSEYIYIYINMPNSMSNRMPRKGQNRSCTTNREKGKITWQGSNIHN